MTYLSFNLSFITLLTHCTLLNFLSILMGTYRYPYADFEGSEKPKVGPLVLFKGVNAKTKGGPLETEKLIFYLAGSMQRKVLGTSLQPSLQCPF